eukprot:722586-Pleurochrysis_carterae.AAC.1
MKPLREQLQAAKAAAEEQAAAAERLLQAARADAQKQMDAVRRKASVDAQKCAEERASRRWSGCSGGLLHDGRWLSDR